MFRNALNCAVLSGQKTSRISAARITRLQPRLWMGLSIVMTVHDNALTIGSSHDVAKRRCNVLPQCAVRHGAAVRRIRDEIDPARIQRVTACQARESLRARTANSSDKSDKPAAAAARR